MRDDLMRSRSIHFLTMKLLYILVALATAANAYAEVFMISYPPPTDMSERKPPEKDQVVKLVDIPKKGRYRFVCKGNNGPCRAKKIRNFV